ncbi:unnamed protein product [Mycena citricolor]|uniref:3'-5' exonuclease domain-containing protein n=1 Tax=Mycena citricolor TaxID=2018698 RepID=A0AAD2K2Q7_9AGAR|nr:unnamed protein product [Mycena citricolor]
MDELPQDPPKQGRGGFRVGAGRKPKPVTSVSEPQIREPTKTSASQRLVSGAPIPNFFLPRSQSRPAALGVFSTDPRSSGPSVMGATTTQGHSQRPSFWSSVAPTTAAINRQTTAHELHQPSTLAPPELAQLQDGIGFLEANDERGDVTAGADRRLDESLVDELTDNNPSANSEAAQAETRDAEVLAESVSEKFLKELQSRISQEIQKYDMPLCYKNGQFFDRAPHPVFSLQGGNASAGGLEPAKLYARDTFIWLPMHLPGHPSRFKCTCSEALSLNDPIARRVRSIPEDFFLYTNRFICDSRRNNNKGCGQSFQGTDPHIIAQLPRFVQAAFPAYISTRGAISKLMMRLMTNTFAARFGPAPFAELVSEIQHRSHADWELMYLIAASFYGWRLKQSFSAFADRLNYAGSLPSVTYLKSMFTDYMSAHRIFVDRFVASLPLTIAKADHTFAFLKHMGGVKGEKIFDAAYTVINEFEEVRGHSLTLTKSLSFVKEMYTRILQGLADSQNPPTQILYTDSPRLERVFHEGINAELQKNVTPVTNWSDLPAFRRTESILPQHIMDAVEIEATANGILQDSMESSSDLLHVLAIAIKATDYERGLRIDSIQVRTVDKILVFEMTAYKTRSQFPPSLLAILTNPSLIKVGYDIRASLERLASVFNLADLLTVLHSRNPPILDLGKLSKLKGAVNDHTATLHALAGAVLKRCYTWSRLGDGLWDKIDCQWQIYANLAAQSTVGLPLSPAQATKHGHPVTLVHGLMDVQGTTKRINITASRSLVQISKVLVPGDIHSLHKQTLEWISAHGTSIVVSTSQLRTRGRFEPVRVRPLANTIGVPAPPTEVTDYPEFIPHIPNNGSQSSENDSLCDLDSANSESNDDSDADVDEDEYAQFTYNTFDQQVYFEVDATLSEESLIDNFNHDALHFMDRVLRLLSKKNSAYKAFAHDFSEAIFIRDQSDEAAVRAVLEKNGISWDYFKQAKASQLYRRIRRIIPPPHILLPRLDKLFNAYSNLTCSTRQGSGSFFTPEARDQWKNLRETAKLGYLSDPPSIPLYYLMGKDRDGLNIYRTVCGTNSIEGGFHMAIRRIFGSLKASAELAECLLVNWILRRNIQVGFHNRTGSKYCGHYALWDRDEIVELAVAVGVNPSFPIPRVLPTRIATSETIGILPISQDLALDLDIATLPRPHITGVPHHRDTPVHMLTHLSTKPTNQYRYLQLRQLTLYPVLPVHTFAEFTIFKAHVDNLSFRKSSQTHLGHERWKNVDFDKFAAFWNKMVSGQSRTVTDTNQRLYYKIPPQLEAHHKRVIARSSELATLASGGNFAARQPFLNMLANTARMDAPAAIRFPSGLHELDLSLEETYDFGSFTAAAGIPIVPGHDVDYGAEDLPIPPIVPANEVQRAEEVPNTRVIENSHLGPEIQDQAATVAQQFPQIGRFSAVPERQTKLAAPRFHPYQPQVMFQSQPAQSREAGDDRCALCTNDYCARRWLCKGKGNRSRCTCDHPKIARTFRVRISEAVIEDLYRLGDAAVAEARRKRRERQSSQRK